MDFDVVISKLTGKPGSLGWAQAYDFKPEDEEKLKNKGRIFAVIGTTNPSTESSVSFDSEKSGNNINTVIAGREILSRLHEEYYGRLGAEIADTKKDSESPLFLLKRAVEKVIKEFSKWEKVQIGVAVQLKNTLYLVSGGGAAIYIMRDGVLLPILKSTEEKTVSASGNILDKDILLIGTHSFFEKFAKGILKASLDPQAINSFSENLAPVIQSDRNSHDIGALVLRFDEETSTTSFVGELHDALSTENKIPKHLVSSNDPLHDELPENTPFQDSYTENSENTEKKEDKDNGNLKNRLKVFLEKNLYVQKTAPMEESYKRRKVSASVGILLLFLLVVSIFFGIRQKKQSDFKKSYETELLSAKHNIEEASNLFSLNPERSRELFLDARGKVLGLSSQGIEDPRLAELVLDIEKKQGKVLGEYRVETDLLTDMGLLSDGFSGTDMVETENTLFILDKNSKKIIKTEINSRRSEVVAGPSKIDEVQSVAAYADKVYILNREGVFDVSDDKKKVLENEWEGEVLPYSYAGNFYVLEKSTSKIWRYVLGENGFGTGKEWLSQGTLVNLATATSWTIDGNIWVLTDSDDVFRFALGNLQTFKLSKDFILNFNPLFLFTGDELTGLYFLDKANGRVLVFDKKGQFLAQYISDEIKNTDQIAASEKEKKILLLNGNKLLSLEIRHLD